ncbi:hypothetical protein CsSME_00015187 [Camellia sinensis var. sinensis]
MEKLFNGLRAWPNGASKVLSVVIDEKSEPIFYGGMKEQGNGAKMYLNEKQRISVEKRITSS